MRHSESSCFEFSGSLRSCRRESRDGAADGPPAGETVAVRRAKLCPAWVRLGAGLLVAVSSLVAQQNRVPGPVDTGRTVALKGNRNPQAVPETEQGPVPASLPMRGMTLVARQSAAQAAALEQLLEEQQDPASPNYRKWLTPQEYADRFGLSADDVESLASWLKSAGFTIDNIARSRTWITFSGTAGQVKSAFHCEIRRYRVDGEAHFANASDPAIPAALEPVVLAIRGLDDFRLKAPKHAIRRLPSRLSPTDPQFTGTNGGHALAPGDLATIYGVNALYTHNIDGAGQKIVVVGQTTIGMPDVEQYRSLFGLPPNDPQPILAQGSADPGKVTNDYPEAIMDVQLSGAMAPRATILYVYSGDVITSAQWAIDQNLAPVVSMSYGGCEQKISANGSSGVSLLRSLAQQANAEGITWLASSGDSGAAGCDASSASVAVNGLGVLLPASLPEVTGVGGTEFNEGSGSYWNNSNGADDSSAISYIPERVWNDSAARTDLSGGGGGASIFFSKPAWQNGPGVPADDSRDVPDVAFTASADHDGYIIAVDGDYQLMGGTSAATPVFAGIVSLVGQYLNPGSGLGNINPTLYQLAQRPNNGVFHDVTNGDNKMPCSPGTPNCSGGMLGFSAGPGYDPASGLGSLNAYNLATQWNVSPAAATTTTLAANPQAFTVSTSSTLTATVRSASGTSTPTGSVTFATATATLGTVSLSGSGSASLTVYGSQLATGANRITASYGGNTGFSPSSGSLTISVSIPTASSGVVPSVVPNPVYQQDTDADGYSWFYTVRLSEIAGVGTTVTAFLIDGTDHSSSIAAWFGSANLAAHGTLSVDLRAEGLTPPVNRVYSFSGVDAGGAQWTQQITVPFYGRQLSAALVLTSSPGTEIQNPDGDPSCPAGYPYYQQLNLQETNGYGVDLNKFLAGGNDDSTSIGQWFGAWRVAPLGSLQANICWKVNSVPTTLNYEVDGTDTAGNKISATLGVPFQGPAAGAGQLSTSRNSIALTVSAGQSATASVGVNVPSGQQWTISVFPANQKTSWLLVSPLSGSGTSTVTLLASAGGLDNGVYTATLVFQSINTIPQFVNVPVIFTAGASSSTVVTGVLNGASYKQAFAPGMILSVFGRSLAGSTLSAGSVPLPLSLGGTSVTVNGQPAPLYYVSPTQLNVQVPYETEAGNAILVVNSNGQIASLAFRVTLSAPGIFFDVGSGSLVPISSANRGGAVVFFITGDGDVSPFLPTGAAPPATTPLSQLPAPRLPLTMTVGGVSVTPFFVGIPYGLVGATQINFLVPQTVPSGVQPVVVKVGSATSASANLTITGGGGPTVQAAPGPLSFALPAADDASFNPVAITSIGWGELTASPTSGTASAPDSWLVAPRRTGPAADPVDSLWKKDGGRK